MGRPDSRGRGGRQRPAGRGRGGKPQQNNKQHKKENDDHGNDELDMEVQDFFTDLTGRRPMKSAKLEDHQNAAEGAMQVFTDPQETPFLLGDSLPSGKGQGSEQTQDVVSWLQLGLCKAVLKKVNANAQLDKSGANYYFAPTPVQAKAIPAIVEGKDVCVRAVTGSGKTAAYLLPLLHRLLVCKPPANRKRYIRSVILVPTRELGVQCEAMIQRFLPQPTLKRDSEGKTPEDEEGIKVALAIGGVAAHTQEALLDAGPDILIATPGRLVDFLFNYKKHRLVNKNKVRDDDAYQTKKKSGRKGPNDDHMYGNQKGLDLSRVEMLILDECDKLLTVVMYDQVREVVVKVQEQKEIIQTDGSPQHHVSRGTPHYFLQMCMFSATMTDDVDKFASEFLVNPVNIDIGHVALQANLRQQFVRVVMPTEEEVQQQQKEAEEAQEGGKKRIRSKRLREEKKLEGSDGKGGAAVLPHISIVKTQYLVALCETYFAQTKTIIFCKYKSTAHRLCLLFNQLALPAVEIQGNQTQEERFTAMARFTAAPDPLVQTTTVNFLITTDVAARGLDISAIKLVINFDLPATLTTYIHRVGRTARIGSSGLAVSLVYEAEDAAIMRKIVLISGTMNTPVEEEGRAPQHMASVKRRDVPPEVLQRARERIEGVFDNVRALLAAEEMEEKIAKAEKRFLRSDKTDRSFAETYMAQPRKEWILSKTEKRKREEEARQQYEKESEITLNRFQNELSALDKEEQQFLAKQKVQKQVERRKREKVKEVVKEKQRELRKKAEKKINAGVVKKLKKKKLREASKEKRAASRAANGKKAYVHGDGKKRNKKSRHSKKAKRH